MSCEAEARKRVIYRVTFVGFVVNLVLTAMKFAAGIAGRSGAMVADAVHSCSDMLTDIVVIAFAKVSAKPRDDGHDYGHGKYETLATILISMALGVVGVGILVNSIGAVRSVLDGGVLPRPGLVALVAAVLSIAAKEILYRYTGLDCTGSRRNAFCPEFRRQFASGRQRHHLFAGFRPIRGEKESGTDLGQSFKRQTVFSPSQARSGV